jgi:leucyl-tRNA synthetase
MELTNALYLYEDDGSPASRAVLRESIEALLECLHPFTPHVTEELWEALGHDRTLVETAWPAPDPAAIEAGEIAIVVQVNGRLRDSIRVPRDATKERVVEIALASENVQRHVGGAVKKEIYVPGKLLNLVV